MIYLWLKAAHILAVIIWMAGMLSAPLVLAALGNVPQDQRIRLRALFHKIVSPAMIGALCLGIALGVWGDWFSQWWLMLKLLLVIAMTGVHGALSGRLRRWSETAAHPLPPWFARAHLITLALLALIIVLVVRKSVF